MNRTLKLVLCVALGFLLGRLLAVTVRGADLPAFEPKLNSQPPLPFTLTDLSLAEAWKPWQRFHNKEFRAYILEQKKPVRLWFLAPRLDTMITITPTHYLTFMWGRGTVRLNLKDGSVKLENVTLDEVGFAFWSRIVETYPGVRAAIRGDSP